MLGTCTAIAAVPSFASAPCGSTIACSGTIRLALCQACLTMGRSERQRQRRRMEMCVGCFPAMSPSSVTPLGHQILEGRLGGCPTWFLGEVHLEVLWAFVILGCLDGSRHSRLASAECGAALRRVRRGGHISSLPPSVTVSCGRSNSQAPTVLRHTAPGATHSFCFWGRIRERLRSAIAPWGIVEGAVVCRIAWAWHSGEVEILRCVSPKFDERS